MAEGTRRSMPICATTRAATGSTARCGSTPRSRRMKRRADGKPGWTLDAALDRWRQPAMRISISSPSAPDSSTSRRPSPLPGEDGFMAQGGQVLHSSHYADADLAKGRKVVVLGGSEIGDRHRGERGQFRRQRGHHRVSRAGVAHSVLRRRARQLQAHPLHPRAGADVRELGHRSAGAARACGRKAVGLGELARAREHAEDAAQAEAVRHGAEGADRGRRQLLGADRNPRLLPDGRRRPHQGGAGHLRSLRRQHHRDERRPARRRRRRGAGDRLQARRAVPARGVPEEAGRSPTGSTGSIG